MAINTTQLIAERKKFLRTIRKPARKTDASIEEFQRELERILKRVRALPEPKDLQRLLDKASKIATNLSEVVRILEKGYIE